MSNGLPLVSVVTITYNLISAGREQYFRQCLESVHAQTYGNIEHIVIDGASSDGTVELIREYSDKGWVRYVSEPDSGIYDAMNKGVIRAHGDYIVFLNSDDYYHGAQGIADSVDSLESAGADFSYAPVLMMNEDGSYDTKHPHCDPNIEDVFFIMPFCHQSMMTKTSVLRSEGMFDRDFKSAGDYEFVIRICLKNYRSVRVEGKFVTFRWGGFSISSNALSIKEVADAYYKNYSRLCDISREECAKIYCTGFEYIPSDLAKVLGLRSEYFNYEGYLKYKSGDIFSAKPKYLMGTWIDKFRFAVFSPKKCIRKYMNTALRRPLRQPMRKIWYAVRFKKLD